MRVAVLTLGVLAACCGLDLALAAPGSPPAPAPPAERPAVELGLAIIQARCVECHDTGFILRIRRPASEWGDLVNEMVSRGADLDEEEIAQVRAYLEKNWSLQPAP